jgi:hypothetical protein
MHHGKIFGPIEILSGLMLILIHLGLKISKVFGFSVEFILSVIFAFSVLVHMGFGLSVGEHKKLELVIGIVLLLVPGLFIINNFYPILGFLPTFISAKYLLILGIVALISGMINFF